jgi:hypothetical protein
VPNDNRLHYIFPFLITLFFYRSHGKQYTLPILSERLIDRRLSTDSEGMAICLGLQAEAKVELEEILKNIESKLSDDTLLSIV